MKVTLTHGDKSVELDLTAEQMASLGLKEEKKKTGYEKVDRGRVYYVDDHRREISAVPESNDVIDTAYYSAGRYYSDKTVAENNSRADTLMRKLRRFAAENGGIPSNEDWANSNAFKYYIRYSRITGVEGLGLNSVKCVRDFGNIYFKSEEACQKAIEEFHDELIWYFTEYQAMLY